MGGAESNFDVFPSILQAARGRLGALRRKLQDAISDMVDVRNHARSLVGASPVLAVGCQPVRALEALRHRRRERARKRAGAEPLKRRA